MFQNAKLAKDHGDKVYATARRNKWSDADARDIAKRAEDIKKAALDKWTRDNVGLN